MNKKTVEEKEEWDDYWKSRSAFRNFVEFFRNAYFSRFFSNVIIKESKGGPILEAGCGSGSILNHIRKKGAFCVGCDFSLDALLIAKQKNLLVAKCDIHNLPFEDSSFEIVFNQGVMEHFEEKEFISILKEFKRISEKTIIIVPSKTSIFTLYDPFKELKPVFYSRKRLRKLMKKVFPKVKTRYLAGSGFLSVVAYGWE